VCSSDLRYQRRFITDLFGEMDDSFEPAANEIVTTRKKKLPKRKSARRYVAWLACLVP
jgi:hypothetical protein